MAPPLTSLTLVLPLTFGAFQNREGFDKRQNRMLGSFDRDVACFHESDGLFLYDGHKTWCGPF